MVLRQYQALDAMASANAVAQLGDPLASWDRLIVELLCATGSRELCGLHTDDVDIPATGARAGQARPTAHRTGSASRPRWR
jgi:hypothetical protein